MCQHRFERVPEGVGETGLLVYAFYILQGISAVWMKGFWDWICTSFGLWLPDLSIDNPVLHESDH